ncbi:hypothetical protein COLU111180_18530 [Cohnella lubricantis]|nr:hypothetical protein [Cohnella lubricantis]
MKKICLSKMTENYFKGPVFFYEIVSARTVENAHGKARLPLAAH